MSMRPCWVEIHPRIFEDNFRFLSALAAPHAELLAIVKANAYGHGLELCAAAAERAGCGWLGVCSVEEGVAARAAAPSARVLVIGGAFPGQGEAVVRERLSVSAWEPWQLEELERAARAVGASAGSVGVHLEIDTGMSRQGVALELFDDEGAERLNGLLVHFGVGSPLRLEAVMTHLFASDEADGAQTESQLVRLDRALSRIESSGLGLWPEWLNVGQSAALVRGQAARIAGLAAGHGMRALMRPGLALYGLVPEFDPPFAGEEPPALIDARAHLRPVLSWKTRIASLREVPAGALIGYNGTFRAEHPMRLALIAAGYADGLRRQLGNRFSLLVGGQFAPLVGRISMDQSVIDVTAIPQAKIGDEVVLIGSQGENTISAVDHARACGTICWEIFTGIGSRVARLEV